MAAPLASLDELKARIDRTLDEDEERMATGALEDLSEWARFHSGRDWPSAASAPRLAKTTVLKAAKRLMNNPDGFVQSRAGDETLVYTDRLDDAASAGTAYFTPDEIKTLKALGGRVAAFGAVQVVSWDTKPCAPQGYVPGAPGTKAFPMFNSDTSPW